jgi:hypothetical protein
MFAEECGDAELGGLLGEVVAGRQQDGDDEDGQASSITLPEDLGRDSQVARQAA